MVKLKYVGTGIYSQGIMFKPDKNDGLYEVDEKTANYLMKTFKNDFILIEKSKPKVTTKKVENAEKVENVEKSIKVRRGRSKKEG